MPAMDFDVFISAAPDSETEILISRVYGALYGMAARTNSSLHNLSEGVALGQPWRSNRSDTVAAIKSADAFIGVYDIVIYPFQVAEYQIARDYKTPSIIVFSARAAEYRNKWAHGQLQDNERIQFLDQLLQENIVESARTPIEFEALIRSQLTGIFKAIKSARARTTRRNPNTSYSVDLDDKIYTAVLRAMVEFRKEETRTPDLSATGSMIVTPSFPQVSKQPAYLSDVFVIMPFKEEIKVVFTDIIQPVCEELKLSVKRGDDFFSNDHIIFEVWYAIANCQLIIADCTGRNPNVFYELGIAHTLGKPAIVITQEIDDLPFDIMGRRAIKYEDSLGGFRKLANELKSKIPAILNAYNSPDPDSN